MIGQEDGVIWRSLRARGLCYTPHDDKKERLVCLSICGVDDPATVVRATNAALGYASLDVHHATLISQLTSGNPSPPLDPGAVCREVLKGRDCDMVKAAEELVGRILKSSWHVAGPETIVIQAEPFLTKRAKKADAKPGPEQSEA
ncbi:unnamed protein product, partial [Mesorhabditis spiculigera]